MQWAAAAAVSGEFYLGLLRKRETVELVDA
jgi:hypothetical protein